MPMGSGNGQAAPGKRTGPSGALVPSSIGGCSRGWALAPIVGATKMERLTYQNY
jgi:hypothetical protein